MTEISIIGAGVAGLTAATALAARGLTPRIYDPSGAPGPHGCSWWAGGMLAPYCEGESAEDEVTTLGLMAADWWERAGVPVVRKGSLVLSLSRDRSDLNRFARQTDQHKSLSERDISALEPDLEDRFPAGLLFEDEAHLAPRLALAHLAQSLQSKGIAIQPKAQQPEELPGLVLDCRGYSARSALGDLRGVRGEMLVLRCPDLSLSRPVRLLHPRMPLYIVPRGEGVYMLGATMIEAAHKGPIRARSALELLSAAYALHPAFGEAEIVETGADLRPAFPDNLPRLRQEGRILRLNGLFRHGFLLAPALAEQAADIVQSQIGEASHAYHA